MKVEDFCFPVESQSVLYGENHPTDAWQAIVRTDNNRLITISPSTYSLVENARAIYPWVEHLDALGEWSICDTSFVEDACMRMDVMLAKTLDTVDGMYHVVMSLKNSYDSTWAVKFNWALYREIYIGLHSVKISYRRHTVGYSSDSLSEAFHHFEESIPKIKQQIELLSMLKLTEKHLDAMYGIFGKKMMDAVDTSVCAWEVFKALGRLIEHHPLNARRVHYQDSLTKFFNL